MPCIAAYAAIAMVAIAPTLGGAGGVPCGACISVAILASSIDTDTAAKPQVAVVSALADASRIETRVVSAAHAIVLSIETPSATPETAFAARGALADLRGRNAGLQLGVSATAAVIASLLREDLAAYLDFVVATDGSAALASDWRRRHEGLRVWQNVTVTSVQSLVDLTAGAWGDRVLAWTPSDVTIDFVDDVSRLAELFPEGLFESPAAADARCEPVDACRFEVYQRADTLQAIIIARGSGEQRARLIVSAPRAELFAISTSMGSAPGVGDTVLALAPPIADAGRITVWLPMTGISSFILRLPAAESAITQDVRVVGARTLTAAEIVARHQAAAARQSRLVRTVITQASTTLTFDVPSFAAPVTIQADTTIFQGRGPTELEQRNVRVNGVPYAPGRTGTPRLPIIEPERAAAMPLTITLTRAYRYSLAGRDTIGGRPAYVIAFAPIASGGSLFAGRAWINAQTFALARVDAVQTGLRGAITASQQIDEFAPVGAGADQAWLLARSDIRQVYQGAGLTSPIHRLVVVSRQEVNPPDFDARLAAAHASTAVMLRETPEGLRYLERHADGGGARAVTGRATRMGTVAAGVLIDPNITNPVPYAGLGYTDFDFLKTGAQVNAFFGGAYGQFAISAPSIAGSRWQLAGSGFAVLARYNDRSFSMGRERYSENIRQRPAHIVMGVLRPLSARTSMRVEYLFDYTRFDPADTTSALFVMPTNQVVHGIRAALETERGGWRLVAWWNPARRQGWRAWGLPGSGEYDPGQRDFQRYGLSATRPWIFSSKLLARVEGAWMGSSDEDRFSRYAFGTVDNPLRGYPSASIRYDRGAVARSALVWQAISRLRLDAFADVAVVRDAGYGSARRAYPGIGAAAEAPGPLGLLLGAEWGYGFRGINSDGSQGTQVFRITAYKVF